MMARAGWATWHASPPEPRSCILAVLEMLCSRVSLEMELGSAFQIPWAKVTTRSERDSHTSLWLGMPVAPLPPALGCWWG